MKPATLLLVASVAANVALLSAFVVKPTLAPPALRDYFARGEPRADAADNLVATAVDAANSRRQSGPRSAAKDKKAAPAQARLWATLHSEDLRTLIGRLRAAGFPPAVIRGVVDAQLESRYAARTESLVAAIAETPYWKPESGSVIGGSKMFEEMNQIYRERSRVLRELLGDDFYASADTDPVSAQRRRYGDMPKQKVDLVQRIADDYTEMIAQVRGATQGIVLPEDREKLALLERERRADLMSVLTPEEFEQFEMRSSTLTNRLRATMTVMNASEDEFRTIFRIYQPVADEIFPSMGISSPAAFERRREMQEAVFQQIKDALGEPRFAEFSRANNPEYQALDRLARSENIPQDAVVRAFSLRDTASVESNRILDDSTASPDQKRIAIKALAERMRAEAIGILGAKNGDAFLKNASWLATLDRGAAFTFRIDGSSTARSITASRPTPGPGTPTPVLHLGN